MSQSLVNTPNALTVLRIILIPVFIVVYYLPEFSLQHILVTAIFIFAAVTDWFDGYLARKFNMESNFGAFLDPVADKLLVSSALIMMASLGWIPAWLVCLIIGRELAVTGLRNIIAEHKKDVSASSLGKYKTGRSCLYINKLEDVDEKALEKLIADSVKLMRKRYNVKP